MIRILFIILLVSLLWLMLRVLLRLYGAFFTLRKIFQNKNQSTNHPHHPETMVKCSHCALHVPESKVYQYKNKPFCCEAHAKAYDTSKKE